MALLEVEELTVSFKTLRGTFTAVDHLSFQLEQGETLGVVGESGSGKSVASLALMGLLPPNSQLQASRLYFHNQDLLGISKGQRRQLRGGEMTMIFQDPVTSLNPCFTVGFQLMEAIKAHQDLDKQARRTRAIELLEQVGISAAATRLSSYPHQLSGGMCQRVMIAMAIACQPRLLIADEPTTALDVTIQAQILSLLKDLQRQQGMALILITHDIAVVAENADRILVMYAGEAVELGESNALISQPQHPYTAALLESMPSAHGSDERRQKLPTIPGTVPDLVYRPHGCQLHPRCRFVQEPCRQEHPKMELQHKRLVRCFYPLSKNNQASSR